MLPNARTRNGVGQTVKDLSEDPYAGADVTLTLTAKDEAGNEGKSEPFNMRLPERLFTKPLARALIEQRRVLALDANQSSQVYVALDALMIAPELFTPEAGHYLGLYSISRQIEAARKDDAMRKLMASAWSLDLGLYSIVRQLDAVRTDDALREVVASLWALAVTIEDGNISDVDKALRAAQEALKQALERGATDEEIKKLTDNLRAALDNFLRQLAEQFRNNPQQLARPLDPNTKMLSQQDLKSMLDRLERMSRSGDKDAAKQLLEQLQQMLENLQMAQPGQGGDDMEQALNELGDMIRKQQQLRDKTYKQGQDSRRERQRGKQGDQSMGDLQQDQQGLRDRLKKLQEELAKRGMGPGQRGQQGQQASAANRARASKVKASRVKAATRVMARTGSIRPITRWATPPAGSARAMPTARWTRRAARWKRCARAPRAWRKPCSRATATSPATAPAIPEAASRARPTRPIRWDGRCATTNSATIIR